MGGGTEESAVDRADRPRAIPEIRPGRDIGWVFRNGDAVVLARLGEDGVERSEPPSSRAPERPSKAPE